MSRKVKPGRSSAKITRPGVVQPKVGSVQPISAVMQKVKGLLPDKKAALHLELATGISLSLCEKLLCGQRRETVEVLVALLRSDLGRDVLFALIGDARPEWFTKYRQQLDIYAAQKQLEESRNAIAKLQQEIAR